MTIKEQFTTEEWARVAAAPMLTGMAVTAADPGGLWGAIKESTAVASALRAARGSGTPLVDEVVAFYETSEGRGAVGDLLKAEVRGGKKPAEIVEALIADLGEIVALVKAKAGAEAPAFASWLLAVAQQTAEAGTEGGFFGFGGVKVSPEEAATLDRLKGVLG